MANISQEQYEEYRRALKRMRMLDDTLMKCIFKDCKPAVEQMLRIILSRDDLVVESFTIGKEYKNLKGHSICMDILAVDKDGKHLTSRSSVMTGEQIPDGGVSMPA